MLHSIHVIPNLRTEYFMKKHMILYVALVLFLTLSVHGQQLQIHHIDVGQADATLLISPTGVTMLIDAGNDGNGTGIILPYLASLGITSLNYIVNSHYHADHLGGLDEVINSLGGAKIGAIYDRGSDAPLPTTAVYNNYVAAANATGKRHAVVLGQILDLGGGVTMKCVASAGQVLNYGPVANAGVSENDMSIGWLLNFNSFQYYTGGDLGGETTYYADNETPMAPQVGDVDVFKVNHHGSRYSTNQTFVNTLKPEVSFIEVGDGNSYGHPAQATIDRLVASNCFIYQTELGAGGTIPTGKGAVANGTIVLKTAGTSYTVTYGTTTVTYPGDGGAPDGTPPVISGVSVSGITSTSAVVTWTTDEASNSVVDYGLTTSYGSTTTNSSMVTSHTVTLTGLSGGTVYHYRVKSTDAAGNTAIDVDHSFQTGGTFIYAPSGTTITYGSVKSGSYSNLATDDAGYFVVNSTTSGTRKCDWYGTAIISESPATVSNLTLKYDGKYSRKRTQYLYLYNWPTSSWTQVDSRTVSTGDVTVTKTQTSPASFISSAGQIRLRVYTSGGSTNYTCSGDFMQFTVETAGTGLSKIAAQQNAGPAPGQFRLDQNYPNPFNPTTVIGYSLAQSAHVTIRVFNMLGQEVAILADGWQSAGYRTAIFNAMNLPTGVYLCRISAGALTDTKKMMLIR